MFEKQIKREIEKEIFKRYGLIRNAIHEELTFIFEGDSFRYSCKRAMLSLLSDDRLVKTYFDSKVKKAAIKADVMKVCIEAASEVISGEEFINSVVKRINEKQVVKQ